MDALRSLTRDEARARADLLAVDRYDIDGRPDRPARGRRLPRGLDGDASPAVRRARRRFVDCAAEVVSAPRSTAPSCRRTRSATRGSRWPTSPPTTSWSSSRCSGRPSRGHRRCTASVDAADKRGLRLDVVRARRGAARLGLLRPARPQGRARLHRHGTRHAGRCCRNSGDADGRGRRRRPALDVRRHAARCRRTCRSSTPGRSTSSAPSATATTSGLYCRQSLASLPRPRRGRAVRRHGGRARVLRRAVRHAVPAAPLRPGVRARHGRRDGELRLRDLDATRSSTAATRRHGQREERAAILLHEMAHMWFGDIVTMRWWDDLWLNEAFAEWACNWATAAATEFTDTWAGFLTGAKLGGYRADRAPTTHPIRQAVRRRRRGGRRLRRHHLLEGRERPQAAGRLRRRGRVRRRPARRTSRSTPGATPSSTT